jgi:hypothetical protein
MKRLLKITKNDDDFDNINIPSFSDWLKDNPEEEEKDDDEYENAKHDFDSRKIATVYINGEFIEALTHGQAIDQYLKNHNYGKLNETWYRPFLHGEPPAEKYREDKKMIDKYVTQMAIGHVVDEDSAVYIDQDYLKGMSLQEAAWAFKKQYQGYTIYNDNDFNYETQRYRRLARLVKADAYEWVKDRAELLQDKNKDMDESMSFGIAWKQWKKKHPSWKGKLEKQRLKKKYRSKN